MPRAPKESKVPPSKDTERRSSKDPDTLSVEEKAWRDRFVLEYVKDFNGTQAMVRCGHTNPNTARTQASLLLREPYVARALDIFIRKCEVDAVVTRQQVLAALWREANAPSNFEGVRVTALSKIATMLGMDKAPKQNGEDVTAKQLGIMLVPVMNVADWQSSALQTQADLKSRAGTEVTIQTHGNS